MTTNTTRLVAVATASVSVLALGTAAANATTPTTKAHRTSLNARATKGTVRAHHTDTVLLTLRSRKKGVDGEAAAFTVRMRTESANGRHHGHWDAWQPVAAVPGIKAGHYRVQVTMPAGTPREQFQVRFGGDAAQNLAASRSQVISVKR